MKEIENKYQARIEFLERELRSAKLEVILTMSLQLTVFAAAFIMTMILLTKK